MKKLFKVIYILLFSLGLVACNEEFLDLNNPNNVDSGIYFKTVEELNQAVTANYSALYFGGLFSREYFFIYDLLGNDASVATALQGELAEFAKYTYGPAHGQINVYWRSLYRIILRSNVVIDNTKAYIEENGDSELLNRFIGEAKFLRAWAYFELVNQFGRIPFKKSLADLKVVSTPRSPEEEVWTFIEKDLTDAISSLPVSYDAANKGRATKGAATALLGKSYLYQEKYAEAATELAKLESMGYQLLSFANWDDNWSGDKENEKSKNSVGENNVESVFEIQNQFTPGTNTWYMFGGQEDWGKGATHTGRPMEYGWNDWQNVYISDAAVAKFKYKTEGGADYVDPRAARTFYGNGNVAGGIGDFDYCNECAGGAKPYPFASSGYRFRKYQNYEFKEKENVPESSNNARLIRYADVLLMRAEALIQTNKVEEARVLVNRVRARAGAFEYSSSYFASKPMELLKLERHLELTGEQVRYRDLVRWGDAPTVLNKELNDQYTEEGPKTKVYFQSGKHELFPIPQSEKDTNPAVEEDVANEWN